MQKRIIKYDTNSVLDTLSTCLKFAYFESKLKYRHTTENGSTTYFTHIIHYLLNKTRDVICLNTTLQSSMFFNFL